MLLNYFQFWLILGILLIVCVDAQREPRGCPRVRVSRPALLFGEWSSWSPCSKTCGGGGLQHRRRQCADSNPGCLTSETRSCGNQPCGLGWSEWCEWEECRATCGVGERMRVRFCEGGTLRCPGKDFQIARCNAGIPCPGFYDWSAWSQCSASCGLGVQHRERTCHDERECDGENRYETRRCNEGPCNRYMHGEWSEWSSFTSCDRPCGGGTTYRRRTCHPSRGFCPGPESESRRCNEFACHDRRFFHSQPQQFIDIGDRCVWTTWTNWSGCSPVHHQDCSMGIGRGEHARQRYCVTRDVRQDCGHQCDGGAASSQQREACSLDPRYDPCRRSG